MLYRKFWKFYRFLLCFFFSSRACAQIGVVLTDGVSTSASATLAAANAARAAGVTLIGIGVGTGISHTEINNIANDPDSEFALTFSDFSALQSAVGRLTTLTCQGTPRQ